VFAMAAAVAKGVAEVHILPRLCFDTSNRYIEIQS
jgi:hypothetical protein